MQTNYQTLILYIHGVGKASAGHLFKSIVDGFHSTTLTENCNISQVRYPCWQNNQNLFAESSFNNYNAESTKKNPLISGGISISSPDNQNYAIFPFVWSGLRNRFAELYLSISFLLIWLLLFGFCGLAFYRWISVINEWARSHWLLTAIIFGISTLSLAGYLFEKKYNNPLDHAFKITFFPFALLRNLVIASGICILISSLHNWILIGTILILGFLLTIPIFKSSIFSSGLWRLSVLLFGFSIIIFLIGIATIIVQHNGTSIIYYNYIDRSSKWTTIEDRMLSDLKFNSENGDEFNINSNKTEEDNLNIAQLKLSFSGVNRNSNLSDYEYLYEEVDTEGEKWIAPETTKEKKSLFPLSNNAEQSLKLNNYSRNERYKRDDNYENSMFSSPNWELFEPTTSYGYLTLSDVLYLVIPTVIITGILFLYVIIGWIFDFLIDVLWWITNKKSRIYIQKELLHFIGEINVNFPSAKLIIVAHSLGSVIAMDAIRSLEFGSVMQNLNIVTMGSPLNYLWRIFPHLISSPNNYNSLISQFGILKWVNLWRSNDIIGKSLEIDSPTFSQTCVGTGGHVDYWKDPNVWEAVYNLLLKPKHPQDDSDA